MLCYTEYYIFCFVQKQLSPIFKFTITLYKLKYINQNSNLYSKLDIYNNYPLLEELHDINALSGLYLYMMALVCQYNGCSMIWVSGRAICKH